MEIVTIIAIDRAEKEVAQACMLLEKEFSVKVQAYQLVSTNYRNSDSYKSDEALGYFEEIVIDFSDIDTLKDTLETISKGQVVLRCRTEAGIQDYSKVISLLPDTIAPSVESLNLSTQKFLMRESMSQRYPEICPKYLKLESFDSFDPGSIDTFSYPLIVKPNGLNSSLFVTKCADYSEVTAAIRSIFRQLGPVYEREYGTGKPSLLIEEFIEGEMYSVDAHIGQNESYTFLPPVRVITAAEAGLGGFFCYRNILPTSLTDADINEANNCASKALKSVGLTNNSAHIELFRTKLGWKIIELGPRIGGYRHDLYMQAYGINSIYNDILIHYGKKPNVTPRWQRHSAGLHTFAEKEGRIEKISGFDEAKLVNSVNYLYLGAVLGQQAKFASNGGLSLVDGVLSNDDALELEQDVAAVRANLKIYVK